MSECFVVCYGDLMKFESTSFIIALEYGSIWCSLVISNSGESNLIVNSLYFKKTGGFSNSSDIYRKKIYLRMLPSKFLNEFVS